MYASLLARGGGLTACPPEPQVKLEPGVAVDQQGPGAEEHNLAHTAHAAEPPCRAALGRCAAPPGGSLADVPSLAALDECLTPANAQLPPAAGGERRQAFGQFMRD